MAGKKDKKKAKAALSKIAQDKALKLADLKIDSKAAARAAVLAKAAHTGKFEASVPLSKNSRLSGKYDRKKKSIELGYTLDFE